MIQRKDPQKRGHAPFLWGRVKKKGFVWGISQPQRDHKANKTCGCSAIGHAGKGFPPVPLLHMVPSGEET